MPEALRVCCVCNQKLNLSEFYKLAYSKDGIDYRCKNCRKASTNSWKNRSKEHLSDYDRKWRADKSNIKLEINRRYRARKANCFSDRYTEQQVLDAYGLNCYLCGYAINLNAPRQSGVPGWESGLHIDHVVPLSKNGPDSIENVRPSHGKCNLIKSSNVISFDVE